MGYRVNWVLVAFAIAMPPASTLLQSQEHLDRAGVQEEDPSGLQRRLNAPRPTLSVNAWYWVPTLRGRVALDEVAGSETTKEESAPRFSLGGNLDSPGQAPGLEIALKGLKAKKADFGFRFITWFSSWSGSGTLNGDLDVGGTIVPAGSRVESDFRMSYYGFDLIMLPADSDPSQPISFEAWLSLRMYRTGLKVETSAGDLEDRAGGLGLGIGGRVEWSPLGWMHLSGELSGSGGFGVPEAQACVAVGLGWRSIKVEAGYRHLWAESENNTETFRLSMGGAFAGISIRF